jgi:lysophospholipase L1-like esterase
MKYILLCLTLAYIHSASSSIASSGNPVPENLFNIGDSIGEAEAADNQIGSKHHDLVWSTGYVHEDSVYSFNERFADFCPSEFQENSANLDYQFNLAVSGATIEDFHQQAMKVTDIAEKTLAGKASMITIFLGNNDVCASSLDTMTPPAEFESYLRAGLDVLASSQKTKDAIVHVSSIPAIYWLWESLKNNEECQKAWQFVPCQNLLENPINDCGAGQSHLDPDTIHADDGPHCIRRKTVHARIRDIYNPILKNVVKEYADSGLLPNGYFNDIFSIRFRPQHINTGDCFHPSAAGQAFLAQSQWNASIWATSTPVCSSYTNVNKGLPWLQLFLSK